MTTNEASLSDESPSRGLSRRGFLKGAGLTSAGALLLPSELLGQPAAPVPALESGPEGVPIALNINGSAYRLTLEPRATLLDTGEDGQRG